jgi:hypothetical protein
VYLTDEHQPDRTTSETPFFCYTHLLMKINVGAIKDGPVPNLDAPRTDGTDQQDAQLAPAYFDVSRSHPGLPCCAMLGQARAFIQDHQRASAMCCHRFWHCHQPLL